jgi:hypothetical protein
LVLKQQLTRNLLLLLLLQGTDFLAMSGSFTSNGFLLPSCANQQSFALGNGQSGTTSIT